MILGVGDIGYKIDFAQAVRLIDRFWELGGRQFDTAHTYAHWVPGKLGSSEKTLGTALRELGISASEAAIITKGGHPHTGPLYPRPAHYLDPDLVRQDIHESLDRLGFNNVDTFLLHRDDPSVPVDEIATLFQELQAAGLTAKVGVSNWSIERIQELRSQMTGSLMWQNQGSLAVPNWREGPEPTMRRFCVRDFEWAAVNEVVCACYSSTSNGYFAKGGEGGGFDNQESRDRYIRTVQLAKARGVTPNQVALAWLAAQPGDVRPIIGTTTIPHLEDAMASQALNLSVEERDALAVA